MDLFGIFRWPPREMCNGKGYEMEEMEALDWMDQTLKFRSSTNSF